jgi:hypothetical protein
VGTGVGYEPPKDIGIRQSFIAVMVLFYKHVVGFPQPSLTNYSLIFETCKYGCGSNCKRTHASTFHFDDDDRNAITCQTVEGTSI